MGSCRKAAVRTAKPTMATLSSHLRARAAVVASFVAAFAATWGLRQIIRWRFRFQGRQKARCERPRPKYHHAALLHPLRHQKATPWNQVHSCRLDVDFLVSKNFTKALVLGTILLYFATERSRFSFGSRYRQGRKTTGQKPLLDTIYLLGMALWYLKTRGTMYSLCPIFRIVGSSICVWMDYSLEVPLCVMKRKKEFEIRWPTHDEQKASAALLEIT